MKKWYKITSLSNYPNWGLNKCSLLRTNSHRVVYGFLVTAYFQYILDKFPSFTIESANNEVDRQHLSANISKSISLFFHRFLLEYDEVVVSAANHVKVVTGNLVDIIEILFRLTQTCFSAASAGIASTASKINIASMPLSRLNN